MNKQELENWKKNVDKVFYAQILLDNLKKAKKINRKQYKEIREKIKKQRYCNLLNSPHLEQKQELKRNVLIRCINDYNSFMGITINTSLV